MQSPSCVRTYQYVDSSPERGTVPIPMTRRARCSILYLRRARVNGQICYFHIKFKLIKCRVRDGIKNFYGKNKVLYILLWLSIVREETWNMFQSCGSVTFLTDQHAMRRSISHGFR